MNLMEYQLGNPIPQYNEAISPGKHCPLFGVCSVLRSIDNITVIYLGTNDCVYFAQKQYYSVDGKTPSKARVISAELTDSDLVFGVNKQLKELIKSEYEIYQPRAIYIVTSCSIEVISEDIEGMVALVNKQIPCKVSLIKTENFKTTTYYDGIEKALSALIDGVKVHDRVEKSFTILGARFKGADTCELVQVLKQQGYSIHSILPFDCTEEKIQTISQVAFSIVVDSTGMETAIKLKQEYGIDYFLFDTKFDIEMLNNEYKKLSEKTGISLREFQKDYLEQIEVLSQKAKDKFHGKRIILNQMLVYVFDLALFLAEMGMIPDCIFIGSAIDKDEKNLVELKKICNPEILQNANTSAVKAMLDKYKPEYYVGGMINPRVIVEANSKQIVLNMMPIELGYKFVVNILNELLIG